MDAVVWITGNVGSEVRITELQEGIAFANFRLACTPRRWRRGEWGDEETTWLNVGCSRALALNVKSSINKGDPVVVAGRLRTERWTDKKGESHERIKLDAQAVGHDLSRGTSVFRRSPRPVQQEEQPDQEASTVTDCQEAESPSPAAKAADAA